MWVCPSGSHCPAGATAPTPCPTNYDSAAGSSSPDACFVAAGYYALPGRAREGKILPMLREIRERARVRRERESECFLARLRKREGGGGRERGGER